MGQHGSTQLRVDVLLLPSVTGAINPPRTNALTIERSSRFVPRENRPERRSDQSASRRDRLHNCLNRLRDQARLRRLDSGSRVQRIVMSLRCGSKGRGDTARFMIIKKSS